MTQEVNLNFTLWPKQLQCLQSEATEILFGGASGGGKSHLIRVSLITWCLAIPNLQCSLIRKKYSDIWDNHVEGPTGFKALLQPLIKLNQVIITKDEIRFPRGSRINFVHCQDERQFDSAQGIERHVLVLDEAPQIVERLIRTFRAWCRAGDDWLATLPKEWHGMFPRILYTGNPVGLSAGFFRSNFVKARKPFDIEYVDGFKRQYIPSLVTDNFSVDADVQRGRLEGLGDPKLAQALIKGDWDAPLGDFYSNYDEEKLVIDDFDPPEHWFRFRTFDWGSAEPFACLWCAVADGEVFGDNMWLPRGAIVFYREWYGCEPDDQAKGLHYKNEDIARGIVKRSWDCPDNIQTLTDSFPFRELGGPSIASVFAAHGVPLRQADTSRVSGWKLLRDRMQGNEKGVPLVYICRSLEYLRYYFPMLQRHKTKPEDAVEDGEATHIMDCARYAVATFPKIVDAIKEEPRVITPKPLTFADVIKKHNQLKRRKND